MRYDIDKEIVDIMQKDLRRDYTIPEIMASLDVKSREKVVSALSRLEGRGTVEISREKGRTKYYRLNVAI